MSLLIEVSITDSLDKWRCNLEPSGDFTVKSVRQHIDNVVFSTVDIITRWNRFVPIKVNIFVWRLVLDCLPTRMNLDKRGLALTQICVLFVLTI